MKHRMSGAFPSHGKSVNKSEFNRIFTFYWIYIFFGQTGDDGILSNDNYKRTSEFNHERCTNQ